MKSALIIATVYRFVVGFERNDVKLLQELGYKVILASNFTNYSGELDNLNIEMVDIPFERNPISMKNIIAFIKLNKFIKENKIELIHCHTPVGGVAGRIIGKLNNIKTIIYTAHGFHFFDGAPKINWLVYYPIEKFLSRWTDILITINNEDYKRAKENFYAKKVKYIPGVGLDTEKIKNTQVDKDKKREELGIAKDDIVLLSIGELNKNKNHKVVIKALGMLQNKKIKYLIAGIGPQKEKLELLAKNYGLEKNFKLLGYRKDIYELCKISDIFVFPSLREGLSVALMEAIASNLPIICSDIRGNRDIIINKENGFRVNNDSGEYYRRIKFLLENECFKNEIEKFNKKLIPKIDLKNVERAMLEIYRSF